MDVRQFALEDWIQKDLLLKTNFNTSDTSADPLTKSFGRTVHCGTATLIIITGKVTPNDAATSVLTPT